MEIRAYIAKTIRRLRVEKLSITEEKLGSLLSPQKSSKTISSWERNRTMPDENSLLQLCRIFDVPISEFYPPEFSRAGGEEGSGWEAEAPLYGSIAAGTPLEMVPVEDTLPLPLPLHRKHPRGFFLRVRGESMNKVLPDGSYAFIDPEKSTPENRKAYALCINGKDATIKRVRTLANGLELQPDSSDPTYKPTVFDYAENRGDEVSVIGQVVWYMMPFDWEA